jgi:pilus assembly protein CpaF
VKLSEKLSMAEPGDGAPADGSPTGAGVNGAAPVRAPVTKPPAVNGATPARTLPPSRRPHGADNGLWLTSKRTVHRRILADVAPTISKLSPAEVEETVRRAVDEILVSEDIGITPAERRRFVQELIGDMLGYGPLDPLLADQQITEIMCNRHDEIWVERAGVIARTNVSFTDDDHYRRIIEKIVVTVGRRVDESSPMVDARLPDGSRVNVILPPLAVKGPVLTIRKFPSTPLTIADLITNQSLSTEAASFLEACVRGKINVLVSGGTGTGKTTILNVLSAFIPENERIITIEEAAELQPKQPHTVSLESRPPNAEGAGEVLIRDLVKNSLRMRPDRIIVGECRGGEALDMLQAMNTGHEGSMTTIHANNPREAMSRLEVMVLMAGYDLPLRAIREQIASAVDLIVHLERSPSGARTVAALTELQGLEGDVIVLQDLFQRGPARERGPGRLRPTGLRPKLLDRLIERGIDISAATFQNNPGLAAPGKQPERLARPTRFRGANPADAFGGR